MQDRIIAVKPDRSNLTGVVLAGGQGQRMGGCDKGLLEVAGRPLFSYSLEALRQVAATVIISANRNLEAYERSGCLVTADDVGGYQGPLSGVLCAMRAAKTPCLVTLPCDVPLFAGALLDRMVHGFVVSGVDVCVADDGRRLHPVIMVAKCALADGIEAFLQRGDRKFQLWLRSNAWATVDFSDCPESLMNVNRPEDLDAFERRLPPRYGGA